MKPNKIISRVITVSLASLGILVLHTTAISGPGSAGENGAGGTDSSLDPRFDTSFAIEYSDSCLSGCHENDFGLVEEHSESFMTHAMVKCNACHGTHTADTVGERKPNLTGYYPGIQPGEYRVGDDRCISCHTPTLESRAHPRNTEDCAGCHTPHEFSARQFGR